jgi:hypothetical protein
MPILPNEFTVAGKFAWMYGAAGIESLGIVRAASTISIRAEEPRPSLAIPSSNLLWLF